VADNSFIYPPRLKHAILPARLRIASAEQGRQAGWLHYHLLVIEQLNCFDDITTINT